MKVHPEQVDGEGALVTLDIQEFSLVVVELLPITRQDTYLACATH